MQLEKYKAALEVALGGLEMNREHVDKKVEEILGKDWRER
jgi:hypothetical protein